MTAQQDFIKREKFLDEYETNLGLPYRSLFTVDDELQNYFVMDRSQIEKLSAKDCSVIAYRLAQYSFHMQRCINREKAMIPYAEQQLNNIIAQNLESYSKFTKHDMKVASICRENKAAEEWSRIIIWAQQRVAKLEDLAQGINNLSYRISTVQKHKEEAK